jgi:hypothetical protein
MCNIWTLVFETCFLLLRIGLDSSFKNDLIQYIVKNGWNFLKGLSPWCCLIIFLFYLSSFFNYVSICENYFNHWLVDLALYVSLIHCFKSLWVRVWCNGFHKELFIPPIETCIWLKTWVWNLSLHRFLKMFPVFCLLSLSKMFFMIFLFFV